MKTRVLNSKGASLFLIAYILISYSFVSMTKNCFSSAMVFIVNEGIMTKFQTGSISAGFYIVYAVLQIFGGILTDKWKPEGFITLGLLGGALANLVVYFNQNYAVMLVIWIFNGIIQCAIWPAVFKVISTMPSSSKLQNGAMFAVILCGPIGNALGYAVAAIVGNSWNLNFLVSAIGLAAFAILWEISIRCLKPYMVEIEISPSLPSPASQASKKEKREFWRIAIKSGLIIIYFIGLLRATLDLGLKGLTATIINESYTQVSPSLATVMNIIILFAGVLGTFFAYIIYPKYLKNEAVIILIFFICTVPFVFSMLFIGKIHYIWITAILGIIVFLTSAASLFTTTYIAARFNKWGKGGTVVGIINSSAALGIVCANTVFTAIADNIGWHKTIVVWISMVLVALLLSVLYIPMWTRFLKEKIYRKTQPRVTK